MQHRRRKILFLGLIVFCLGYLAFAQIANATIEAPLTSSTIEASLHHASSAGTSHSYTVSPLMIIPFVALLLGIAVMPFINKHFWEHNYPYVSYALGAFVVVYYIFSLGASHKVFETLHEYISFICLIGSLFIVTGGIVIKLKNEGTPFINSAILLLGAIVANILGTTGASMLLIRPFIRINSRRLRPYLIVFFIFIVSNIGGALTPIGDPPLFLGYLQGVPFFWVMEHVFQMWGLATFCVLFIFFIVDYVYYSKDKVENLKKQVHHLEEKIDEAEKVDGVSNAVKIKAQSKHKKAKSSKHRRDEGDEIPGYDEDESLMFKIYGYINFIFLFFILVSVFLPSPWREIIMTACAILAYKFTPAKNHAENGFNFDPIKEVAILFIGIFATMMPALDWLEANAASLGIQTPGQFYWGSGALSSFLDNAPTYLNFLSAAKGLYSINAITEAVLNTASLNGVLFAKYVVAISLGSVFFGANTYIGNGPNFMVKNIAEQMKVEMPSFFGYIFYYSVPVLIPVFALVWAVFLR